MNKLMRLLVFGLVTVLGLSGFTSCDDESSVTALESDITANNKPIAYDQNITLDYGTRMDFKITGSDADDDTLTFVIESNTTHGTIVLLDEITGDVRYTPNGGYTGTDHFTFKAVDEKNASSNIADVNITVKSCSDYTTDSTCTAISSCIWLIEECVPAAQ